MKDDLLERSPVHRTVYAIVQTHATREGDGMRPEALPALAGFANPTDHEQAALTEAVEDLKAHGEVVELDGRLFATDGLPEDFHELFEDAREPVADGSGHAVEAEDDGPTTAREWVEELTAGDSTTGAPRTLVEERAGEAEVAEAIRLGEVYEVDRRLKVTPT